MPWLSRAAEPLQPGSDVILDWSSAVQLAETLLFYIRGFVDPERSDDQADFVPGAALLHDQGDRAARAQHLLPMSVLNAGHDRFEQAQRGECKSRWLSIV
jgi:hypothetical protein